MKRIEPQGTVSLHCLPILRAGKKSCSGLGGLRLDEFKAKVASLEDQM